MNRLTTERRAQIIGSLVEGNSIRATVRMTGAAKNTITKLLADLGKACADYQDGALMGLPCEVIEADEIWAYCYAKNKNVPEQFKGTPGLATCGPSRRSAPIRSWYRPGWSASGPATTQRSSWPISPAA